MKAFQMLMEQSHPAPAQYFKKQYDITLSGKSSLPIFLNVNITDPETGVYKMQNESSIAVNPKNPENLIGSAVDYRDSSATWVYISHDGGKTWINKDLGRPFPGWTSSNDPSVAFDPEGNGYLVYGGFGIIGDSSGLMVGENGVFIARSSDEGNTWTAHIPVMLHRGNQTLDSTFEDKYYISIDNSPSSPYYKTLYIPWKRVTPRDSATQIVLSKSTDKGNTWSTPVNVSSRITGSSEDTTFGQSFPLVATGPEGEVYVVWNHGIEHGIGFSKSTDGGLTFTEPRIIERYKIFGETKNISTVDSLPVYRHIVKGKVRAEAYPVIVCDTTNGPNRGTLYLCWAADNPPNVYFAKSNDGGDSWSEPVFVSSDTTNDQFWPWLSLDPKIGDLAVMYLDSRNDPANILVECYVSYSSDGGNKWTDRRVADFAGDLRNNPFQGNSFAGDYSGNAFYDGKIYPSWIDMRAAETNIFDSDVYTALINTRMPAPVDSFKAVIIPDKLSNLNLSWWYLGKRAFGQIMNSSDYSFVLLRNNVFLTKLDGNSDSFLDTNLIPHEHYTYSICAVSVQDSSAIRKISAYAGGSREPASPEIISYRGSETNDVTLDVKMPSFRSDSVVPLVNLSRAALYRDSSFIKYIELNTSDTGKVISISDKPDTQGYYSYFVSVLDSESPANESEPSNVVNFFTGKINESLSENFDSTLPHYRNVGNWGVTSEFYHSSPYSFTESPYSDYKSKQNYIFDLFPVVSDSLNKIKLKFFHAAIVHRSDTAFLELSYDMGNSWTVLKTFNESDYHSWADGVLNYLDWKYEVFDLSNNKKDTVIFRFRLQTNVLTNDIGWFIDDIKINCGVTGVDEMEQNSQIMLFPNPAKNYINVSFIEQLSGDVYIKIYSVLGNEIEAFKVNYGQRNKIIDLSGYLSGIYFLQIIKDNGVETTLKFIIFK